MNKIKLIITILMTILLFTGCQAKEATQEKNNQESTVENATQEKNNQENTVENATQEKNNQENIVENATQEKKIAIVNNGDYAKAYAEALTMGLIVPTEEADRLLKKYEEKIKYEPRFVKDTNEKLYIIWTNDKKFLVINGQETQIKVSECIYLDQYPVLPKLEELEEMHRNNREAKYGIAENSFLEELSLKLKEKELYTNGLYWARFYNYNGKAVVVYSLTKNGELYMNEQKINN